MITATIPSVPPSVNHYWLARGKSRFISQAGKDWHALAQPIIANAAQQSTWRPLRNKEQRLKITVLICYPDNRERDVDNSQKAIIDAVAYALHFNDAQIDLAIIERGVAQKGKASTTITIEPYMRRTPDQIPLDVQVMLQLARLNDRVSTPTAWACVQDFAIDANPAPLAETFSVSAEYLQGILSKAHSRDHRLDYLIDVLESYGIEVED